MTFIEELDARCRSRLVNWLPRPLRRVASSDEITDAWSYVLWDAHERGYTLERFGGRWSRAEAWAFVVHVRWVAGVHERWLRLSQIYARLDAPRTIGGETLGDVIAVNPVVGARSDEAGRVDTPSALWEEFEALPPKLRTAVELLVIAEFDPADAAALMGVRPSVVTEFRRRGLNRLASRMGWPRPCRLTTGSTRGRQRKCGNVHPLTAA